MDSTGAVVPRAKITITDPNNGKAMQLESDKTGKFSESSLPPGSYSVKVTVPGFTEFQHPDTIVKSSQETKLEITLQIFANGGVMVEAANPVLYKAKLPSKLDGTIAKPKP